MTVDVNNQYWLERASVAIESEPAKRNSQLFRAVSATVNTRVQELAFLPTNLWLVFI